MFLVNLSNKETSYRMLFSLVLLMTASARANNSADGMAVPVCSPSHKAGWGFFDCRMFLAASLLASDTFNEKRQSIG